MNLKIENLKVKLNELDKEIISDASFELNAGEIILLNGENGSGKSSLLSAIFKHPNYNIESGKIFLNNEKEETDLTNLKTFEIAKQGLYLSLQHVPEIEGVNLLQFLYRSYKNISEDNSLSVLDFNKELISFCDKYDINKDFLKRDLNVGFSGGEKKQAEMLHLFALKPKFVFMDEIDSGVDKEAIKKVFKIINDFNKEHGVAFCIISHREKLEDLIKIDRSYEMKDGKLNLC
ncbi:MAG: putative transporter ATP-binding protein [Patescibacteria group bacterium]|nr:putative transporter ATP-binding protein [Patescibacteria group bacterium]